MGAAEVDEKHIVTNDLEKLAFGETTMRCSIAERELIRNLRQADMFECFCDFVNGSLTVRFAVPIHGHGLQNLAKAFMVVK